MSGLPVEKNVFAGLRRKVGVFSRAFDILHGTSGDVDVVTGSSTNLSLPDQSVNYVFTDPPFGANIPYSEINQVNELWLGRATDTLGEVIISKAQGKGVGEYQALLTDAFTEMARVMTPSAEATVVFHSAHASVWQALSASLLDSGLSVSEASVLDKTQASFKQVNGHIAVSGDPILRVRRSDFSAVEPSSTMDELAHNMLGEPATGVSGKRDNERLYSRLVGQALVAGTPVTVDARRFYEGRASGGVR